MKRLLLYAHLRSFGLLAAVLGFALLRTTSVAAQTGTVTGKVASGTTLQPLAGAEVSVVGLNLGTRTSPDGSFVIPNVPAGPHEIRVIGIGFKPITLKVTVTPGEVTSANAQLTASVL